MPQTAQQVTGSQRPASGTATVVVACKHPPGIICRIHAAQKITEALPGGGSRDITQFFQTGDQFLVKGPAHGQNEGPRVVTASGFALTFGVPKALWDAWYEQNKTLDLVRNGLIHAYEKKADAVDCAREHKGEKTGLERLNPKALPQLNKRFKVQTAEQGGAKIGRLDEDEE